MRKVTRVLGLLFSALAALTVGACGGGGGGGPRPAPGAQVTQVAVEITAGTMTVAGFATHMVVTGSATDTGRGTATVDLSVLSNYPRLLFNLKAVVGAISDGTAAGDGLFAGDPYT